MAQRKKRKMAKLDETMQNCMGILRQIQGKSEAVPFLEPVDWEYYQLTDYPEIIKHPMDLLTIQEKIESGRVTTAEEFIADVRLVWKNAMTYNRSDSDIFKTADKISKVFEKKIIKLIKKDTPLANNHGGQQSGLPGMAQEQMGGRVNRSGRNKGGPASALQIEKDRISFGKLISQLPQEDLNVVIDRVAREAPDALNEEEDEEVEIDVNNLSPLILGELNLAMSKAVFGKKTH